MPVEAPSLPEIVKRNWTLEEFIGSGYLDNGEIIPMIKFRGDDPAILEVWAKEISPKVAKLYRQLGWDAFKDDLLLVYNNSGRLLVSGNKSSVWFKQDDAYLLFTADRNFDLIDISSFEDIFLNVISLNGEEIMVAQPEPLDEGITEAYDVIYNQHQEEVDRLVGELTSGRAIKINGFPIELAISPIIEMVDGYLFVNAAYEFIVIGEILTPQGRFATSEVYSYPDGYRLTSILAINPDRWEMVDL